MMAGPIPSRPPPSPGGASTEGGRAMAADEVFRAVLGVLPTYLQRDGHSICTTCGAVVGGASADQIRHTTWHTMLAALVPPDIHSGTGDTPD